MSMGGGHFSMSQRGHFLMSLDTHGRYRLFESVKGYFFYLYDGWNLFDVEMPSFENLNEELDAIEEISES